MRSVQSTFLNHIYNWKFLCKSNFSSFLSNFEIATRLYPGWRYIREGVWTIANKVHRNMNSQSKWNVNFEKLFYYAFKGMRMCTYIRRLFNVIKWQRDISIYYSELNMWQNAQNNQRLLYANASTKRQSYISWKCTADRKTLV